MINIGKNVTVVNGDLGFEGVNPYGDIFELERFVGSKPTTSSTVYQIINKSYNVLNSSIVYGIEDILGNQYVIEADGVEEYFIDWNTVEYGTLVRAWNYNRQQSKVFKFVTNVDAQERPFVCKSATNDQESGYPTESFLHVELFNKPS